MKIKKILKLIFHRHKWKMVGKPWIYNAGFSKLAEYKCEVCGATTIRDIFKMNGRWGK